MAHGAIFWRRFVEQYRLCRNQPREFVTLDAPDILVRSAQRKLCSPIMIEQRRLPLLAVVTVHAGRDLPFGELLSMDIVMALFALHRRGLEIHVAKLGFKIRRLVAIHAGCGAMRSQQGERGLRMVESRQFLPRLCRVARFTSRRRAIPTLALHTLLELPLVWILVTTRAFQILPVIDHGRLGLELRRFLVAIRARDCNVRTAEHKMRLFMFGESKGRGLVALQIVAAIASVQVGRGSELPGVPVGVAIGTGRELDLKKRVFSLWNMTLRAFQPGVTSLQWICAGSMVLDSEP